MSDAGIIRFRRDLDGTLPAPAWPAGIRPRGFEPADAAALHALLDEAYGHGGGGVASFEAWWTALHGDDEFEPALVFLAESPDGLCGAAHCWSSGFVKDLVVAPDRRRHGVGAALLMQAFAVFQERGAHCVELKMDADNPSGAGRLYARVGMRAVL